jgi:hypothetical protein
MSKAYVDSMNEMGDDVLEKYLIDWGYPDISCHHDYYRSDDPDEMKRVIESRKLKREVDFLIKQEEKNN